MSISDKAKEDFRQWLSSVVNDRRFKLHERKDAQACLDALNNGDLDEHADRYVMCTNGELCPRSYADAESFLDDPDCQNDEYSLIFQVPSEHFNVASRHHTITPGTCSYYNCSVQPAMVPAAVSANTPRLRLWVQRINDWIRL